MSFRCSGWLKEEFGEKKILDSAKLARIDMTRRCSHCGHNGHNSRTCPDRGVKLFGVRLTTEGFLRKSMSMGSLSHYTASASGSASASVSASASGSQSNQPATPEQSESGAADDGYLSDGMVQTSKSRERKKGVPWTEEEHKMFLVGLQKLGKGDWRGISRNFVTSRTPTQVASHAQKYFLRQSNLNKRKRRSSLFDISADTVGDCHRRIPEIPPSIHELTLSQSSSLTSGNFFEAPSPNLAISVGAFPLPSFAAPSLISPPSLSLGISSGLDRTSNVYKIAAAHHATKYSFLTIPEHTESGLDFFNPAPTTTYSFPLPLWPELSTSKRPMEAKEPEKGCLENEDSELSLSIAPPCVELELDSQSRSAFHSNSNAIRVV